MTTFSFSNVSNCTSLSGIYAIRGLYNNYNLVGQTTRSMYKRWKEHIKYVRCGLHENSYFQNSYNKHGEDKFVFVVLEEISDLSLLNDRESYWIEKLDSMKEHKGWNLREGGAHGVYGKELRARVSAGIRSSEKSLQSRYARRKTYTLISPDDKPITFRGRRQFCKMYGIGMANLHRLLVGEVSYAKGWRLPISIKKEKKIEKLTTILQRNCPDCGCVIEYGRMSSKKFADENNKRCMSCAAKDFRQKRMREKYQFEKVLDSSSLSLI